MIFTLHFLSGQNGILCYSTKRKVVKTSRVSLLHKMKAIFSASVSTIVSNLQMKYKTELIDVETNNGVRIMSEDSKKGTHMMFKFRTCQINGEILHQ